MAWSFIRSNKLFNVIFQNSKLQKYKKLLQTVWKNKPFFCIFNVSSRNGIMIYCVVGLIRVLRSIVVGHIRVLRCVRVHSSLWIVFCVV